MNIKEVQKVLLEMLKYLDNFCKQNKITYYLAGGTLLGAVRNHGFIPWDDDVDVMMDRENYDKFVQCAMKDLCDDYFLQCPENDPNWHYNYTKLRKNGTVYATTFSNQFDNLHQGVFLDIFVQDKTANAQKQQKAHETSMRFYKGLLRYKWRKSCGVEIDKSTTNKLLPILSPFFSLAYLKRKSKAVMTKYQNMDTNTLIDSSGMHLSNGGYDESYLGKPQYMEFEGESFPVPEKYDLYLRYLFGDDYMTPIEYRHDIISADI